MLIQSNDPKHYSEIRKHWARAENPFSKDPMEGVLRVSEDIASQMPDLGLPRMPKKAREAFVDVLKYERPPGNGSVRDILTFVQARGYCSHPCDWVPSSEGDAQFPEIYEPWAAWLAENNYTPFYEGVRLTAENFDRWKPKPRYWGFYRLWREDADTAFEFFQTVCAKKPAAIRRQLADVIGQNSITNRPHPDDVQYLLELMNDQDEKIRDYAKGQLDRLNGFETKEDHAKALLKYFKVSGKGPFSMFRKARDPKVIISPQIYKDSVIAHSYATDLDALASVLGITPKDFVSSFDIEDWKGDVGTIIQRTTDTEARNILARRITEAGKTAPASLFKDADPELWQTALELNFESEFPFLTFKFLEPNVGALDIKSVRRLNGYLTFVPSILRELKTGELPVNTSYDALRFTALVASKDAAAELLEEALGAGIAEDNPRLTMLKLNLAL